MREYLQYFKTSEVLERLPANNLDIGMGQVEMEQI